MIFWCTSLPWWHHLNKPTSLCPLPSPLARRQDQERVRKRAVSGSERDERMRLTCRTKSIYSLSSCNYSLSSLLEMNIYCSNVRQANLNKSVMGISSLFSVPHTNSLIMKGSLANQQSILLPIKRRSNGPSIFFNL